MKRILNPFLLFILAACAQVEGIETPTATPIVINTMAIPTSTSVTPVSSPTVTSTKATTEALCDPFSVDFCILEGHFVLQRPTQPPANDLVDASYLYGSTANGTREPHHGIEFPNPSGTPVYAAANGTVIFAGADSEAVYCPWPNFYGNLIVLQHENRLFTLYAHLSKIDVKTGQVVKVGTPIGEVGRTGVAIGSHLHFEVRQGEAEDYFATQNPELWLVPAKDASGNPFGTLAVSVVDENRKLLKYAQFTIGYYSDPAQSPISLYYETTYSSDMLNSDENAVLGELPVGRYRIAIERYGTLYERWVEVESGKLTQVAIVVK